MIVSSVYLWTSYKLPVGLVQRNTSKLVIVARVTPFSKFWVYQSSCAWQLLVNIKAKVIVRTQLPCTTHSYDVHVARVQLCYRFTYSYSNSVVICSETGNLFSYISRIINFRLHVGQSGVEIYFISHHCVVCWTILIASWQLMMTRNYFCSRLWCDISIRLFMTFMRHLDFMDLFFLLRSWLWYPLLWNTRHPKTIIIMIIASGMQNSRQIRTMTAHFQSKNEK